MMAPINKAPAPANTAVPRNAVPRLVILPDSYNPPTNGDSQAPNNPAITFNKPMAVARAAGSMTSNVEAHRFE